MKFNSMIIEGRKWFQKTYGNTYHSVRIIIDGICVIYIPFEYGYGDHYKQTAWEWLYKNGYVNEDYKGWSSWESLDPENWRTKIYFFVVDVRRKKDL